MVCIVHLIALWLYSHRPASSGQTKSEDGSLIKNDNNARRGFRFECVNLDNPLFSSRCYQKEASEGTLLSRELTVKQTDLTDKQMQNIYPDIVKLNRIDESYMIKKH